MARRAYNRVDRLCDSWARWLSDGRTAESGGADSMLARLIDNKGELNFGGGGGGSREPRDTLEERVEILVYQMAKTAPLCADALRLEYAAGAHRVAVARGWKHYTPGQDQLSHALLLGVSLRTYRTRLAEARGKIAVEFGYHECLPKSKSTT